MSICYHGYGTIRTNKENGQEFSHKLDELVQKYDRLNTVFTFNKNNGHIRFKLYANHHFITDFENLVEDNMDKIKDGYIWFHCDDEDGCPLSPFPFKILVEITDGKLYEETMDTRLSCMWGYEVEQEEQNNQQENEEPQTQQQPEEEKVDHPELDKNRKILLNYVTYLELMLNSLKKEYKQSFMDMSSLTPDKIERMKNKMIDDIKLISEIKIKNNTQTDDDLPF